MLWFRTPEKVYFKKGCMPVALDELKTEYTLWNFKITTTPTSEGEVRPRRAGRVRRAAFVRA